MHDDPHSVTLRPERDADHDAIRSVVTRAFGSDVEGALVDRIRASQQYEPDLALVAVVDDFVVGHVMISGAVLRSDVGDRRIVMLSPLAVAPEYQRRGIGGALVRASCAIAGQRGEPVVVLEGGPRFYGRLGFEHSVRHGIEIELPDWAPPEAAQVLLLASYDPADPSLRGTVEYPAAFDGLE